MISFLIISCAQRKKEKKIQSQLNTTSMTSYLEHEKEKITQLMKNFPKPLQKITATPSASELSALYAVGYEVTNEDVFCVIYVYENQQKHEAAREFFRNNPIGKIENTITSSNGGLFFYGWQNTDNPKARYILNDLASAFSGEE